jgi:hypothetical protein
MRVLDPADFSALWEACTRCFYLAVASGFPRPRAAAPLITPLTDRLAAGLAGRRAETLAPGMPAGVLETGGRKVQSAPIDVQVPEGILRCVLQGTLDFMVRGDDGAYTVVELALAEPDGAEATAIVRRLHAYAHALERDDTVAGLGLLSFEADSVASAAAGALTLGGRVHWRPIARDESAFFGFLAEALTLLERPLPPPGTALCPWCVYRDASRRTSL